jgi:hypothetical protein
LIRFIMMNTNGMATTTIQAPCVNFVTSTMSSTTAVTAAPTPLTNRALTMAARGGTSLRCSRRFQCRTIPAWLNVNDTKTPMMYS